MPKFNLLRSYDWVSFDSQSPGVGGHETVGLYAQKFKTRHQPITEKHGPVCNVITLEFFVVPDVVFSSYRFSNFSHNRFISSLILAMVFFVLFSAKRSRGSLFSVACGWAMPCTFL